MDLRVLTTKDRVEFNKLVTHVVQSWEWGEFRQKLGLKVLRYGIFEDDKLKTPFQLTLHPIPFLGKFVGYLPKGSYPDKDLAEALTKIGKENNCVSIKVEPNIVIPGSDQESRIGSGSRIKSGMTQVDSRFIHSKPMFTKHNFLIDLTQPEEKLLAKMHPKTRYNIKVAQKHGVKIEERVDDEAFKIYLKLYFETTRRQGYHGHNQDYHKLAWQSLRRDDMARVLIAFYQEPETKQPIPLTAWMLFNYKDTLYYPYGGSSELHRQTQASTLLAWEAIKLGKKMKLKTFDLWGALGEDPDPNDPFIGFHRFKKGLGGELVKYLGSFDLILNPLIYQLFNQVNKFIFLKVLLLKLLGR